MTYDSYGVQSQSWVLVRRTRSGQQLSRAIQGPWTWLPIHIPNTFICHSLARDSSCRARTPLVKQETVLVPCSSMPPHTSKPYSDHPGFSWRELSFSLQLCFLAHFNSSTVTALISLQTVLLWAAAENPGYLLCICVPVSLSRAHTHTHTHSCSANLASYLTQNWLKRYWNTHMYSERYSLLKKKPLNRKCGPQTTNKGK